MRLDNISFPQIDWIKNKRISSPIDFEALKLNQRERQNALMVIDSILQKENLKCEFITNPILQIIDYNDRNIEMFSKLRDEPIEGAGLFMYKAGNNPISILYSIKNGMDDVRVATEDPKDENKLYGATKKMVKVYTFSKNMLVRAFISFYQGIENNKEKHISLTDLCHQISGIPYETIDDDFQLVDDFMIFKKYAELDTKIIPPKSGVKFLDTQYVNNSPKGISIYDSTYFTNIIKSDGFGVKGHFRLQRYGEGRTDKRLIWINDFQKDGYTRKAKINKVI